MSEKIQKRHLHFDCVSGMAGDMSLGAFLDVGVPIAVIQEAIVAIGLDPRIINTSELRKWGLAR